MASAPQSPIVESRELERAISWFYTALVGLSLRELMNPVGPELRGHGPTLEVLALATTFLIVSFRYWLGNQLHLIAIREEMRAIVLWDAAFIMTEGMLILYLAGLGTPVRSDGAVKNGVGFMGVLALLSLLDCLWILSIRATRRVSFLDFVVRREKPFVPWGWFWLNAGLTLLYVALWRHYRGQSDYYHSPWFLGFLLGANVVAGLIDVVLIHHYMGALVERRKGVSNG